MARTKLKHPLFRYILIAALIITLLSWFNVTRYSDTQAISRKIETMDRLQQKQFGFDIKDENVFSKHNATIDKYRYLNNNSLKKIPLFKSGANLFKGAQTIIKTCKGNLERHGQVLILFKNIRMDYKKAFSKAVGNMDPKNITHQNEHDEEYSLKKGFFTLQCFGNLTSQVQTTIGSHHAIHFTTFSSSLALSSVPTDEGPTTEHGFTIATMR